ncbi:C-X-C motif chemokine 13 [Cavia porcellus]|uniref:Chemokine interleukin-8-like domain-containing protein n=1 Tax=Cavia porcellus TaxID=10141 RepID=H0UW27_CAVPO
MRLSAVALLLSVLISSLSPGQGILEAYNTNLKCRCMQETSQVVRIPNIHRLRILPPGNGCPKTQIIIQLRNKTLVCLNPAAKWVQQFVARVKSRNFHSTAAAPVMKKVP